MLKKIAPVVLAIALTGCALQQFDVRPTTQEAKLVETQHFFVGGIAQAQQVNAEKVCGASNVARVETQQTGMNVLFTALTFGIYSPLDIRVYCAK